MEPEVNQNNNNEETVTKEVKHTSHTYEDDLAKALDATDAKVVQQMLSEGREREQTILEEKVRKNQRGWYKAGAIILLIFTSVSLVYSIYHYRKLTVPAEYVPSVGVFPNTETILSSSTDIRNLVDKLKANTDIIPEKPSLVSLVGDENTLVLLTVSELFNFFESQPTEPFLASFNIARLGIINIGTENVPFVIASTNDIEVASKELLIAEPKLLQIFYQPLGIDISAYPEVIGKDFTGEYMYNIPVRALRYDTPEKAGNLLFFYAKATDQIVVFTTKPEALKAIYDSLIRQQN